jgi:hypothetical protein
MMFFCTPPFILQPAPIGGFFFAQKPNVRAVLHFACVLARLYLQSYLRLSNNSGATQGHLMLPHPYDKMIC